jgi:putative molybdopterin biosynthesis protein
MRRRYLRRLSLEQALERWLQHPACRRLMDAETVRTAAAAGRVTAEPVYARRSVPYFHCSAVDGIAVRAASTFGASETSPRTLDPDDFVLLDTGDPIPDGFDAVVMIEDVRWVEPGAELIAAASPWQHVRLAGEDVVATEMVLTRGHRLRPADVATLLACGVLEVAVHRRPQVAILPTGDELVEPDAPPEAFAAPGRVVETNSHLIAGMVAEWGGEGLSQAVVPDDAQAVRAAIREATQSADVVALNAGSSAGRDDYVPAMIEEMGDLLAHGVEIMPGKPVALGVVGDRPVLAVPGYPVSAYVVCEQFLRPLLYTMQGLAEPSPQRVPAVIGRRTPSKIGQEEFLRVKAGRVGDRLIVVPLARGASLLSSIVRADGVVRVPAAVEGLEAGDSVELTLLRELSEIENSLLILGSHDITLDLIADLMREHGAHWSLSSAHVGSFAGLTALRRGECHVAGTHLLDEESGIYNLPYLDRLFPHGEVALVHLVRRTQGLIVAPGNPLGLRSLQDLVRPHVRFVNRQRGSGTRVLLDHHLKQSGIESQEIFGYERELYTHLAVASAVATGGADAGLGIQAAAKALDLEFVPIGEEQYDLAIRADAWDHPAVRALRKLIESDAFREAVAALGGYDASESGAVLRAPG